MTLLSLVLFYILISCQCGATVYYFKKHWTHHDGYYSHFSHSKRADMKHKARQMFYSGYDNYMKYAFPLDELNPVLCKGRGPDYSNPSNININDVLGDYALTLVDSLDTLAIMGNTSEFKRAVSLVLDNVSFDKSNTVQVFEATIRVLGGLLSAHLLIEDSKEPFGHLTPLGYDGQLLHMAHDLASRLLPAFEGSKTGLPYPRVNLRTGVPPDTVNSTCTAGVGTLLLEMGLLSSLLGDPVYASVARRALHTLWGFRSNVTGLVGNIINVETGQWEGTMSGLGAGLDSFYEYMLKAYILFGDRQLLDMFDEAYESIKYHLRRGRRDCNRGAGYPPIYVNVNMKNGETANNWIDSLQAAWPGVQVLKGDIEEAICTHALYYTLWQRYHALPERYNWNLGVPEVSFYPLRPELVESTYLLYRATKNPFYLHVGKEILDSLNTYAKSKCGYATIHDVNKKDHEDRMESFFLSETCKYLYLLFDEKNPVNVHPDRYLFSTEGHLYPTDSKYRRTSDWTPDERNVPNKQTSNRTYNCEKISEDRTYFLPIKSRYLSQLQQSVGLH